MQLLVCGKTTLQEKVRHLHTLSINLGVVHSGALIRTSCFCSSCRRLHIKEFKTGTLVYSSRKNPFSTLCSKSPVRALACRHCLTFTAQSGSWLGGSISMESIWRALSDECYTFQAVRACLVLLLAL